MSERVRYYVKETGYGYGVFEFNKMIREFLTEEEADEFKRTLEGSVLTHDKRQDNEPEVLYFDKAWDLVNYLTTTIAPFTDDQIFMLRKTVWIDGVQCHTYIRCKTKLVRTCSTYEVANGICWIDSAVVKADNENERVLPMTIRQTF